MTHNDIGHINNLNQSQYEALKKCWIVLTDAICEENSKPIDEIVGSNEGDALFHSIGYDNPDVLILRWLRARKWDIDAAVQQLMETLKWRKESAVDNLLLKGENELNLDEIQTKKSYYMGYDKVGRPISYIHVREHIKDQFPAEQTEKFGIFSVEIGRKLLKESIETGTVVIDMSGFGMNNMDYTLVKYFLHLLENFYPESLGLALIVHSPLIFYSCWAVIKHWLDPVIQNKIHFLRNNQDLLEFIHPSNIPKCLQGNHPDFQYVPPSNEEKTMQKAFYADKQGRKIARANHRRAARDYLNITLRWANGDENLVEERKQATRDLRDTFERFVPYIHNQTCYHRIGMINEPIFNIAYQNLCERNQLNIVQF
ncbi:unnamed protein product [Adineta ricciae]|uniref:CRAL-TRIO domain-containing protein n=1 Tax=Adineta ricciae TaxID=249248 RepID=A0A815QK28_ADIRI|nr:unnamed protein product [Adineta ricciae]CAF1464110.1 unnamed protein product [Adineta ricciae]